MPEAVPEGYVGKFGLQANPKTMSRNRSGEESTGTPGGGRVSWDEVREWHGHIYTTKCKIDS